MPLRSPVSRGHKLHRCCSRRGSIIIYVIVLLPVLVGLVSLAVDYGRVQMIKSQEQSTADATVQAYLNIYKSYGAYYASYYAPSFCSQSLNPVDAGSGTNPTTAVTPGTWDTTTSTFTANGIIGLPAVKVTVTRTAANNNAVPILFGAVFGRAKVDVQATSIGALFGGQTGAFNLDAKNSPYLAGMPSTYTSVWGDTTSNATPYGVGTVPVVPGTWITVSGVTGTTSIVPGTVAYSGPDGDPNRPLHHGENYNSSPNNPGPENGIGDAVMPADALMGVFLTNSAPNTTAAPATVDWTSAAMADKASYSNIVTKEPFLIGNGRTTSGVTQKFLVPPGATRMFLGIWDGVQYSNNAGTLIGNISVQLDAKIVQ